MSFKKLEEFITLAKDSGACELKYETKDGKFEVKFPVAGTVQPAMPVQHVAQAAPVATPAAPVAAAVEKSSNEGLIEVTSPFVGTFYASPSPDADNYVNLGDKVAKGKVLCIVEAMKIMNEIESDASGEIVEICVENETYVEFGQVLYRIKP